MTCLTSKRSDRTSSYGTLHSMPFIWRPCNGDNTASHVVCPRSTCKKANVFAKEPPTSVMARRFRDRTHARSVFDGMRITHGFFGQCRYRSNSWRCLVGFHGSFLSTPPQQKGIATHACMHHARCSTRLVYGCRITPRWTREVDGPLPLLPTLSLPLAPLPPRRVREAREEQPEGKERV